MKLVCDRIPEIIKKAGKEPITRVAHGEEYYKLLLKKLKEEVQKRRF